MTIQSDFEQLVLELTNRARLDPSAEAQRFDIDLNEGLAPGTITPAAKQPLAMNDALITAARGHSQAMIDQDFFAHVNPSTGKGPQQRANDAGYSGGVGENIASRGSTGAIAVTATVIQLHQDLFVDEGIAGRGHRTNTLSGTYKELGVGVVAGQFTQNGTNFNSVILTEDFGIPSNAFARFLTGVAFDDIVISDLSYTVGEGRASMSVNSGSTTTTGASGGYSLAISTGAQTVTFSGGGMASALTVLLDAGTTNVKLDVFNGNTIFSSADFTLVSAASGARLLGVADLSATGSAASEILTGNRGNNILTGNGGNDTLNGGAGNDNIDGGAGIDTAQFSGLRGANTITKMGLSAMVSGPDGTDGLSSIERLQFSDASIALQARRVDGNGDLMSDLVLRQASSGTLQLLQMNGLSYEGFQTYAWGLDWQVLETKADFNGDGRSDLLLKQASTGTLQLLIMDGFNYTNQRTYAYGTDWRVAETQGDFNADGKSDVVLQQVSTGMFQVLQMDGLSYTAQQTYAWGPDWQMLTSRDLNGDGKSDLLLRQQSTGTTRLVQMDGVNAVDSRDFAWGLDWQVLDKTGDLNGDGNADLILRQSSTGTLQLLQMDGLGYTGQQVYAWGTDWNVADGRGDFNSDGKSDLVLRQASTGKGQVLQMVDLLYTAFRDVPGSNWQFIDASSDFNSDGKSDLLLRETSTGSLSLLQMDGVFSTAQQDYAFGQDWQPIM